METGDSGPKVVVGLDFGTTFSGFAFAHKAEPSKVFIFYEWPEQSNGGGRAYCKTQTALFYSPDGNGGLKLENWGWPALVEYRTALSSNLSKSSVDGGASTFKLVTKFKLHLAGSGNGELPSAEALPSNLTTKIVITDYLREISKWIVLHLQNRYGKHLCMRDIRWCLTVPAIWDDQAKQLMKSYAEDAGLIESAATGLIQSTRRLMIQSTDHSMQSERSPYPLVIVLEPEAAAIYCLQKLESLPIEVHEKFLTADIGGGTVDIVVHEKLQTDGNSNFQLKEVARSSGGLCGGTYVDKNFLDHLAKRIGCLNTFLEQNPLMLLTILRWWEGIKSTFDGKTSATFDIPSKLARAWEMHNRDQSSSTAENQDGDDEHPNFLCDEVIFTAKDLLRIFDPVVEQILWLITNAVSQFDFGEMKVIMAVGGFSANPYLMKRLQEQYKGIVREVVSPPDPGSAVCQGAAILGTSLEDIIVSRVCRKTYGMNIQRDFEVGDPISHRVTDDDGVLKCDDVFSIFIRMGDEVPVNHTVTHIFFPSVHFQKSLSLKFYSSTKVCPKYSTESDVVFEGKFGLDISEGMELDKGREVAVTMFFGRSSIEVEARGVNFAASGRSSHEIPLQFSAK